MYISSRVIDIAYSVHKKIDVHFYSHTILDLMRAAPRKCQSQNRTQLQRNRA
jgi:hypothetical protein